MKTTHMLTTQNNATLAMQDHSHTNGQTYRGQIVLVHGLGEHMGRYQHVIQHLNDGGFAVRTYDQYGHGLSSGKRGCLPSENRLLDDLALVIDDTRKHMAAHNHTNVPLTNTPLILLGHSMGGLVVARFVSLNLRPVDALVLSSPALGAKLKSIDKLLLAILPTVAPNLAVANGLDANKISHDPEVVKAYLADSLIHNKISPRLGKWIMDNGAATLQLASTWSVPTLLMYAGQDKLVDPAASRKFTELVPKSLLQSTCYEDLYHEIFNEVDSKPVFEELRAWLDARF
jgi:alpha-beta hydrolase superfamily lysophospholipase